LKVYSYVCDGFIWLQLQTALLNKPEPNTFLFSPIHATCTAHVTTQ